MRRISLLRRGVALPVLAALVTSAVVAAVSLAGQTASPNGNATGNGQILGQPVGQLVLETGGTPIPIFSYSWGASNPTSFGLGGGGIGAGKVSFSSFNLMKQIDSSSAGLFTAVARGTIFPKITVTTQWGTGPATATWKFDFENAMIESAQDSGSGGSTPAESVSIAYEKVTWTFTDASTTKTGSWNLRANTP